MPPRPTTPARPAGVAERALFWLALAAAAGTLLATGGFQPLGWPVGFDWWEYAALAWRGHNDWAGTTHAFRTPVYPMLLGALGGTPYIVVGVIISSAATWAMVACTAWGARALVGPLAGGVVAVLLAMSPAVQQAQLWQNPYPLLALGTAASLAYAAWVIRSEAPPPWPATIALAGTVGLVCSMDWRGVVGVVTLAPALGLLLYRGAARSFGLSVLPLVVGVGAALANPWSTGIGMAEQVAYQREQGLSAVLVTHRPALAQACLQGLRDNGGLDLSCRRGLATWSAEVLDQVASLPIALVLVLCLVAVIPTTGRSRWHAVVLAPALGALLLISVDGAVTVRYLLHLLPALMLAAVVGAARLLGSVRLPTWAGWVGWVLLLGIAGRGGPRSSPLELKADRNATYAADAPLYGALFERFQPGDRVVDCTGGSRDRALLPALVGTREQHRIALIGKPARDTCSALIGSGQLPTTSWVFLPAGVQPNPQSWVEVHRERDRPAGARPTLWVNRRPGPSRPRPAR